MAHYAAAGAHVTLVTCTLGEEGEIHVPELAAARRRRGRPARRLPDRRAGAPRAPRSASTDHRFLGGAGRYRDSGMMGLPTNEHPRAFWRADLDEAAGHLVEIMREIRPQVMITYDPNGFYGHPDHIQAHRVAMRAAELAGAEGFGPRRSTGRRCRAACSRPAWRRSRESTDNPFAGVENVDDLPFGTPDEEIAARIDATDQHDAKVAAMRAHATQIPDNSWLYAIAGDFGSEFMGVEYFTLAVRARGAPARPVRLGERPVRRAARERAGHRPVMTCARPDPISFRRRTSRSRRRSRRPRAARAVTAQ